MEANLGQSVLNCKAKVSYDEKFVIGHNVLMADRMSETEEELAFIGRVRAAREAKFKTPKPVYSYLGVRQDHYKHWETKRAMPRRFIPKFCTVTEVSMEWLLTGEGAGGPVVEEYPKETPKPARKPLRRRAA